MLGLIVSSNLLVLFACWELVGVASYLLIGFWFEKPGPAYASKKAFMTTKLGDMGFYIGLLILFKYALGLGNIVAYRIPTPAKLWDAFAILIPFVGGH